MPLSPGRKSPAPEHPKEEEIDVSVAYPFWNLCVSDITPDHLPQLLSEYKRLALFEHTMKKKLKEFHLTSPDGSFIS